MMKISHIRSAKKFKQTVLLIDDQSTVLDIHMAILKSLKLKLNIVAMTNPIEALQWMQNKMVDLIMTDFHMLPINGMQFVQAVKQMQPAKQVPIIVVTVLNDQNLHQALQYAGASACLTKPVDAEKLASIAKALLEKSKDSYIQSLVA